MNVLVVGAGLAGLSLALCACVSFVRASGEVRMAIPYPRMRGLLGGRHFNFMRGDLERVLLDELGGEHAPVRVGMTVESFTERNDRVTVRLSSGSVEDFDLLVAAEGVLSKDRARSLGSPS